jgi:RimJ/RimL family protein N-acetyltransferase
MSFPAGTDIASGSQGAASHHEICDPPPQSDRDPSGSAARVLRTREGRAARPPHGGANGAGYSKLFAPGGIVRVRAQAGRGSCADGSGEGRRRREKGPTLAMSEPDQYSTALRRGASPGSAGSGHASVDAAREAILRRRAGQRSYGEPLAAFPPDRDRAARFAPARRERLRRDLRVPIAARRRATPPLGAAHPGAGPRRLEKDIARTAIRAEGDVLALAVVSKATGDLVGDVDLDWRSAEHRLGEIGFLVHPDHQGKGYATEAARPLLRIAFEDLALHRVIARTEARNTASARVLEKLGMRREAHLVENEWVKGEWQSELVYAILAREWRASVG